MPVIRNPFRRAPGEHVNDENSKPAPTSTNYTSNGLPVKKSLSEASVTKPNKIDLPQDPIEYKLSEINDSGVYLPPSPGEAKSFWSLRSSGSRSSSHNHRNVLNENEPFNISRESFDSYRRSFDISARSPVLEHSPSQRSRQSLEARALRFPSQQSFSTTSFTSFRSHSLSKHPSQRSVTTLSSRYTAETTASPVALEADEMPAGKEGEAARLDGPFRPTDSPYLPPAATATYKSQPDPSTAIPDPDPVERFEDITLADPKPKRHGLFARFVGSATNSSTTNTASADGSETKAGTTSSHSFFGRKRGGSGQGAELGNMIRRPASRGPSAVAAAAGATATPAPLDKTGGHANTTRTATPADSSKGPFARPRTPVAADKNAVAAAIGRSQTQTPIPASDKTTRPQTPVTLPGAQEVQKTAQIYAAPASGAPVSATIPAAAQTPISAQPLPQTQAPAPTPIAALTRPAALIPDTATPSTVAAARETSTTTS